MATSNFVEDERHEHHRQEEVTLTLTTDRRTLTLGHGPNAKRDT